MKTEYFFIIILLAISVISCEDSFSPKAPLAEEYALYSILNADTTFQTAYLSRSYDIEGFDPYTNGIDPALEGADIKIRINDSDVYTLTDAETARSDTARYKTPFKYYSTNSLKLKDFDRVEITATLNNGKVLRSESVVPPISLLYFSTITRYYFPNINSPQTIDISILWKILSTTRKSELDYFLPQLEIVYAKADNPDKLYKAKVARKISKITGAPVSSVITHGKDVFYFYESIVKTLESISEGDPQKNNYIIHDAEFTIIYMDRNVASYAASAITFRDEFSVRIDAGDFSNIQNGYGLFGIYSSKKAKIQMAKTFIHSFGYKSYGD